VKTVVCACGLVANATFPLSCPRFDSGLAQVVFYVLHTAYLCIETRDGSLFNNHPRQYHQSAAFVFEEADITELSWNPSWRGLVRVDYRIVQTSIPPEKHCSGRHDGAMAQFISVELSKQLTVGSLYCIRKKLVQLIM
jgi:hypothetical protein